jgi:protein gp37
LAENSKIEWTHHTFNPWIGCTKVSPGCKHCYAEAQVRRMPAMVHGKPAAGLAVWGDDAPRRVTSDAYWRQPLRWNREAQEAGERRRVFCASMADVFEVGDDLDAYRGHLWALIEKTPHLDWLLLTKRPHNVMHMVPASWISDPPLEMLRTDRWPRNAWIGATMEDQKRADERAEYLLRIPAAVRFVSYEPALEAVDFRPWFLPRPCRHALASAETGHAFMCSCPRRPGIDWLIVGGESGPGARPFNLAWARSARKQCLDAGTAFFFKQAGARPYARTEDVLGNGSYPDLNLRDRKGGDMAEWPADLRVREWPEVRRG